MCVWRCIYQCFAKRKLCDFHCIFILRKHRSIIPLNSISVNQFLSCFCWRLSRAESLLGLNTSSHADSQVISCENCMFEAAS